ncbi:hypothetical protein RhiLY_02505 [Ceratobasidium sp. AG-Ba]|nr:hypothetical protein RhiLY_02505 [Ceratobasidium sp. AG-Ba]
MPHGAPDPLVGACLESENQADVPAPDLLRPGVGGLGRLPLAVGAHARKRRKEKEERRREKKARRKEKKEKRERKKHKSGKSAAVTGQWGQYGIINDSDMYNKDAEFRTWLVEECKINPETLSKDATKKQFAKFVEDYNTATLPHEKFYNMEAYERRMNLIRSGETLPVDHSYNLSADLAHERIEAGKMKALGLEVKTNMGVRMETEYE